MTECRFSLPGELPIAGTVTRTPNSTVGWEYRDPDGSLHHSLNSSVAAMTLDVGGRTLTTAHGAVYELGITETDHGIPLAPFSDG
jgi:hypothetical protein